MSDLLKYANGNHPRSPEEKEEIITKAAAAYEQYMDALGFDWRNDPNSADTPRRVAKAFVNDLAQGCFDSPPKITAFDNVDKYDGLVFQGNIKVNSFAIEIFFQLFFCSRKSCVILYQFKTITFRICFRKI